MISHLCVSVLLVHQWCAFTSEVCAITSDAGDAFTSEVASGAAVDGARRTDGAALARVDLDGVDLDGWGINQGTQPTLINDTPTQSSSCDVDALPAPGIDAIGLVAKTILTPPLDGWGWRVRALSHGFRFSKIFIGLVGGD